MEEIKSTKYETEKRIALAVKKFGLFGILSGYPRIWGWYNW